MKLVAMRCEFCGARLIRATLDTAICKFCDMGYLIDRGPVYVREEAPIVLELVEEPEPEPEVEEDPEPYDPPSEEQQLRDLMTEEKRAFTERMRDADVARVGGRWQVRVPESLLLHASVGMVGMAGCALFAAANPAYVMPWFAVGAISILVGGMLSLMQFCDCYRLSADINQFDKRRAELRNELKQLRLAARQQQ